jgi:DNA-binding transcriptional ArsR family regulator
LVPHRDHFQNGVRCLRADAEDGGDTPEAGAAVDVQRVDEGTVRAGRHAPVLAAAGLGTRPRLVEPYDRALTWTGRTTTVTAAGSGMEDPSADVLGQAAAAFGLLATPARLHIVWALAQGESDVTGLAERVGGALPAVSQHLTKLKLAGLVRARREGRRQVYFVDDPDIVDVVRLMMGRLTERAGPARRLRGV